MPCTGVLVQLRLALNFAAGAHILAGQLTSAELTLEEDRLIADATGNAPIAAGARAIATSLLPRDAS